MIKIDLVDRSQLGDIQYLKNQYEWLLELNDDELLQTVFNANDVQNALIELLKFVEDVANLPELWLGWDLCGEPFNPRIETSDEWLDIN